MSSSHMNSSFFQEVYANYNMIWQQVLKLTLINNNLVDYQSFLKIIKKSGIDVESPYCQFLLKTCLKVEKDVENTQYYSIQRKVNDISTRLIDYRLFLNSSIKALSQEPFDNETFIIEQFWKSKFGDNSQRQVSIEEFNQAFYQFFNRDTKILSIDYIEQILNESFSYLLKKNKKVISKRSFRKVVKRNFKDIFNLILFNFQTNPNSAQKSLIQDTSAKGSSQQRRNIVKDDSISGYIQTTYYPDSLDGRSQRLSKKLITSSNNSRTFFNETSTFQNPSSFNNRSKSTDNQLGLNPYSINHSSSYDFLAQKVGILSEQEIIKTEACVTLFEVLTKTQLKLAYQKAFISLKNIAGKHHKKMKRRKSRNIIEKENQLPQLDSIQNDLSNRENMFSSTLGMTKRKPLQERETFSFNRNKAQEVFDSKVDQSYQHYQKSQKKYEQILKHFTEEETLEEVQVLSKDNPQYQKLQSVGSLQYSTTPSHSLYNPILFTSENFSKDQPFSAKSNNYQNKPVPRLKCETQRQDEHLIQISAHANSEIQRDAPSSQYNDHTMRELERRLEDIRSSNTFSTNSRRMSHQAQSQPPQNMNSISAPRNSTQAIRTEFGYNLVGQNLQNPLMIRSIDRQTIIPQFSHRKQSLIPSNYDPNPDKSTITDITPISIREGTPTPIRIKEDLSLTNRMNQNQAESKQRKPKEVVYFEKKYKKSKERMRTLVNDNANEKNKNQALQKCNYDLGEKLESLEEDRNIMEEKVQVQQQDLDQLREFVIQFQRNVSLKNLVKISGQQLNITLRNYISNWRVFCQSEKSKQLHLSKIQEQKLYKILSKTFQSWQKYSYHRQTRKEQRKIFKMKCKFLKMIMRKRNLNKKRKAFQEWKGPYMQQFMIKEVQRDMKFAHNQVKTMRFILSFNKIEGLLHKKELLQKLMVYTSLKKNDQVLNCRSNQKRGQSSDTVNRQKQQLLSPVRQQSLFSPNHHTMKNASFGQTQQIDYNSKAFRQRQQQNIISGIEIMYQILKKQNAKAKFTYFQSWRIRLGFEESEEMQREDFFRFSIALELLPPSEVFLERTLLLQNKRRLFLSLTNPQIQKVVVTLHEPYENIATYLKPPFAQLFSLLECCCFFRQKAFKLIKQLSAPTYYPQTLALSIKQESKRKQQQQKQQQQQKNDIEYEAGKWIITDDEQNGAEQQLELDQ